MTVTNCGTADLYVEPQLTASDDFDLLTDNEVRITPGGSATFVLEFAPTQIGDQTANLRFRVDGELLEFQTSIAATGIADPAECPTADIRMRVTGSQSWEDALDVLPNTVIELDGSQSIGLDPIVQYDWSITSKPTNSAAILSDNASTAPTLTVDELGTYAFELSVEDQLGRRSCEPAQATLEVNESPYGPGIAVELTWKTPLDQNLNDDNGTDLDLHFLHPMGQWNTPPYDIFWDNLTADWDPPGAVGDAEMTIDDTDGAGPEVIVLPQPQDLTYSVGVYYYDTSSFGASYATVRVYFDGQIVDETPDVFLAERQDFWLAFSLDWTNRMVTAVDRTQRGFP